MGKNTLILLILSATFAFMLSCERDNFSSDPKLKLEFSTDTVLFDTVFTTIGSATRRLKVYNKNKNDIRISSVRLMGGSQSFFRMNVDGEATTQARDITLRRGDSIFVFVEVTVDPSNQSSPLFIADSIVFETNRNIQDVKLLAWGQDVYLHSGDSIEAQVTFANDKPHLVYDYLWVKPNAELIIQPGTQFYMHNNALLVVDGSLKMNGTFESPIKIEGDRLEPFYRDKAGQWAGIWLRVGSHNNVANWAMIKNGIFGFLADSVVTPGIPTLAINNSRIENMSSSALYGQGAHIEAGNCLFANTGQTTVALTIGGRYRFLHCTIANYWGQYVQRKGPALRLNNFYTYKHPVSGQEMIELRDLEEAFFSNCIIYGSRENEFEIDNLYNGQPVNALMNFHFENSILRVPQSFDLSDPIRFNNVLRDNPKFKKPQEYNYQLDTLSPAKDVGLINTALLYPLDLLNINRLNDLGPDLGAYERVELP